MMRRRHSALEPPPKEREMGLARVTYCRYFFSEPKDPARREVLARIGQTMNTNTAVFCFPDPMVVDNMVELAVHNCALPPHGC